MFDLNFIDLINKEQEKKNYVNIIYKSVSNQVLGDCCC